MKNNLHKNLLIFVASVALLTSTFASGFELTPVVGLNLTKFSLTSATDAALKASGTSQSMGLGYAFGGLVGFSLLPDFEFETGLIYSHHKVEFGATSGKITANISGTFNQFQIPAVIRFNPVSFFGVGGGFYYSRGTGDVTTTTSITGFPTDTSTASYSKNDFNQNDFGLILNARGSYSIAPLMSAILDARYLMGLTNFDTDNIAENAIKLREIQLLAGLSIGF